jgi:dihydrofolate reductase
MARLIYSAIASLDGYVEDEQGTFDWAAPDDEVLAAVNDLERPIGTYLYGETSVSDISIGGAELAGQAITAGLVDECHLFLNPILVGGGKHALPAKVRARLELLDERRFSSGVVHLHHRISV